MCGCNSFFPHTQGTNHAEKCTNKDKKRVFMKQSGPVFLQQRGNAMHTAGLSFEYCCKGLFPVSLNPKALRDKETLKGIRP